MKTIVIATLAALSLTLGGCQEKKPAEEKIITTRYKPSHPQGTITMPADSQAVSVQWLGSNYHVHVVRTPLDSITVTDDNGQKYTDNRCHLTIMRQDGTVFLEKTFLKSTFLSYVKEPFRSSGILAGVRFVEAGDARLEFSVAIAMPDAADDLFVPLDMEIDRQGGLCITEDDDMGMLDYEDEEDDES